MRRLEPHTNDRDALELMARLLVSGGYRVPVEGTGSRPGMQQSDIAHARAKIRDALAKDVAMAVASRTEAHQLGWLASNAYRRVLGKLRGQVGNPLKLGDAQDRFRLRIVVLDALHDLVWPEKRQPWAELAKRARMRRSNYVFCHRVAMSVLQETLNNARADFEHALFGY